MPSGCAVCGKGPPDGVSVFRMNEKGGPGLWACNEHKDHFDSHMPDDVLELTRLLEGQGWRGKVRKVK